MNIVIAMDSFKGSLTSIQAGKSVEEGIKRVFPEANTKVFPIADGGEGTVDALVEGMGGMIQEVLASDPLGRKIRCRYGIIPPNKTAVIEMSAAAGITLLKKEELNPLKTTTYGVGEIIADALGRGCRKFIIGIGGSATNDGGAGMLCALGFGLLDEEGKQVPPGAGGLSKIRTITDKNVPAGVFESEFLIACDVENPLCGEDGCSRVFAPQKGADAETAEKMDGLLFEYSEKVREYNPKADRNFPGAGAAGGMGFAFMSFLGGRLEKGIKLIIKEMKLEEYMACADIAVTGEGKLDAQSVMGKAPVGIAETAKKYNLPVIAFAGSVDKGASVCNGHGIDAYFSVSHGACTLEDLMKFENAYVNLADEAEQVFRVIRSVRA